MSARIPIDKDAIADFCRKWSVTELALFGSVLRDDFGPESDVDVLVAFDGGRTPGLGFITMEDELSAMFGRKVDLLTRSDLRLRRPSLYRAVRRMFAWGR